MRISEAIAKADVLRPNALPLEQKVAWLYELEANFAEMMEVDAPVNKWSHEDETLLMPYPHDNVYVYYLCAQIANGNQDTTLYENDATVSNQAIQEARAWWRRHHRPRESKVVRVM